MSEFAYDLRHTLPLDFGARELRKKAALLIDQLGAWVDASSALTKSTPYDDDLGAKEIAYAAHILSEWLDDAAPLHEHRYREPGKAVLKFAAYMLAKKLMGDTPNGQ